MDRLLAALLLVTLVQSAPSVAAQDANRPINDILDGIKKRAADAKRDDQRRALQMLQRAEHARQMGRIAEAEEFARKAQHLFPESPDIRRALAGYQAELRSARERADSVTQARTALEEAIEYAAALIREDRLPEARELLGSVRQLAASFPAATDLTDLKGSADALLRELERRSAGAAELVPTPPALLAEPMTPSEMRLLLARRLTVEWRDEPLSTVFPIIQTETGLAVRVDPYFERLGVFDLERMDLRISNVPLDRLLRMVADMAGASYVLMDGEIYLTTKANALALAVARPAGRGELLPPLTPAEARRRLTSPVAAPAGGVLPTPPP